MKTFPLRKGLGGWFLGGCFYFNILKYFKLYIKLYLKIFNFILLCLRHLFVKGWPHHNPPQASICNHGVMVMLEYFSNRGRLVRWPQEAFGGAPLHLAWRSKAISWKLLPILKSHCPHFPELAKPQSHLSFYNCSPTVLSLKLSFLKLSSSPLSNLNLVWPSLTLPLQGTSLRTPRWCQWCLQGGRQDAASWIFTHPVFNRASPVPFLFITLCSSSLWRRVDIALDALGKSSWMNHWLGCLHWSLT